MSGWLNVPLREITGKWVSPEGAPGLRIYRNRNRKRKETYYLLELTYKKPQAVYSCPIRQCGGVRYFNLYGRVGLAYDRERDVLLLSTYGVYIRAEE